MKKVQVKKEFKGQKDRRPVFQVERSNRMDAMLATGDP
jgi:hypothetical protein